MKLYRLLPLICATLLATQAQAFIPNASQIARFQPGLLAKEAPFTSKGQVLMSGKSFSYSLQWFGARHYRVELGNLSPSLFSGNKSSKTLQLHRKDSSCILKTDFQTVSCSGPGAWPLMELWGNPGDAAQGLHSLGLLSLEEVNFAETDSRQYTPGQKGRSRLVVGNNNKTPVALIEIAGTSTETDASGFEYPSMQFDQSFLAPMQLKTKFLGEFFNIAASSDLDVRRDRNRFTYVLSNRLLISNNSKMSLQISREDPKPDKALKAPGLEKSLSQIDALRDSLSLEGQFLIDALLLSH